MLMVTKPGGHVVLRHHVNEAEHERYRGFHQYNFDEQDGDFVIWNKNSRVLVRDMLPSWAEITQVRTTTSIEVIINKRKPADQETRSERDRARIRDLHEGVVTFYTSPFMSKEA